MDWLYDRFAQFKNREDYEKAMLSAREDLLRDVLRAHPREGVVCYGKAHWAHYRDLFDGVTWSGVRPF